MKPLPIRCLPEKIAWWIRIWPYFSALFIPLILTKSPTPFAVKYTQAKIKTSPCLTVKLSTHLSSDLQPFLHTVFSLNRKFQILINRSIILAQSVGTVEYTDCFSAEGVRPPPNECPGYYTKQSGGEVRVMLAATPHNTPTVQPPASYHENYSS